MVFFVFFSAFKPFMKCNSIHRLENTCYSKLSCGFHGLAHMSYGAKWNDGNVHVLWVRSMEFTFETFLSVANQKYKYTHTNDFRCASHSALDEDKNELAKRVKGWQRRRERDGRRSFNMMEWRERKKCVKIKCSLSGFVWMWHKNHFKWFAWQNAL